MWQFNYTQDLNEFLTEECLVQGTSEGEIQLYFVLCVFKKVSVLEKTVLIIKCAVLEDRKYDLFHFLFRLTLYHILWLRKLNIMRCINGLIYCLASTWIWSKGGILESSEWREGSVIEKLIDFLKPSPPCQPLFFLFYNGHSLFLPLQTNGEFPVLVTMS